MALERITIPESITNLATRCFWGCTGLTNITFDGDAPTVGAEAFIHVTATVYYQWDATGFTNPWEGLATEALDQFPSSSSLSSLSSISTSSESSLYGYLSAPVSLQTSYINPAAGTVRIEWTWTNPPAAVPQEPSGFLVERRIGSRDWEMLSWQVPGNVFEYTDTLSTLQGELIFVGQENLEYKVSAYWTET